MLTGCGDSPYQQEEIKLNGDEAEQVHAAIKEIRQEGVSRVEQSVDKFAAPELTSVREAGLQFLFKQLAKAESVELTGIERFGKKIYRATIIITESDQEESQEKYVLLVKVKDRLFWAGLN